MHEGLPTLFKNQLSVASAALEHTLEEHEDKSTPNILAQLPEFAGDSRVYRGLLEMEKKLDWTMNRKKTEVQDVLACNHYRVPPWKFSTLIKRIVVELDHDPTLYPVGNIIEWPRGPTIQQSLNGFTVRRMGDQPTKVCLIYLERTLDQYKVAPDLGNVSFIWSPIFTHKGISDCEQMAQNLDNVLETKEDECVKERERKATWAPKYKGDEEDRRADTSEWQSSFRPNDPVADSLLAGQKVETLSTRMGTKCLRRGIALWLRGPISDSRSSLFLRGVVCVIFTTGTLALGINALTKTSVFCGDSPFLTVLMYRQCAGRAGQQGYDLCKVVFYALPMSRAQRLVLSKLPSLSASFPVTLTLVMDHSASGFVDPGVVLWACHMIPAFSLGQRNPSEPGISALAEPSNLALVALFRSGAIHKICAQPNLRLAKCDFILLMAHLFGQRYLPSACMKEEYITDVVKKSPPMVILPPLSKAAHDVLIEQDSEILQIFTGYALTYGTQHKRTLGPIISSLLAKGIYWVLREMNRRSFTTIFTVRRSLLAFAREPRRTGHT
ncbi:hypothetical protein EDB19DRAFT_1831341 [Suillus lakei]|nr:hypothetical protein EDB19DRAFT_1831341 [Suillus lakei]